MVPGGPDIRNNGSGGTLVSGVPPTLITAADHLNIPAGQQITVRYNVVVTNPVASTTLRYLTNAAAITSDQDPVGHSGTVTDEVNRTPVLKVVKTGPATALVGDTITYSFAVSHDPSSDGSPVHGVTISDNVAGTPTYVSGDDGDGILQSGETWQYTRSYTVRLVDPNPLVNTVSVNGIDLNGQAIPTATATHSVTTAIPTASLSLTKTTPDTLAAGNVITYTVTARNTGNLTLTGVQISEGLAGATVVGTCNAVTLAPNATQVCTFHYTATQANVDAGSLTNSASVVGTPPSGPAVTATSAVTLTATRTPSISLTKTTPDTLVAGGTVNYTVTARNTGNVTLTGVQISEGLVGATVVGTCNPVTLAPNATTVCTFRYTATQADVDAGSLTNSASVVGTPPTGPVVTATRAITLTATRTPAITLTKTTPDTLAVGNVITYTVTARNTGNVTLTGVQISEGLAGATVVGTCTAVTLAPNATKVCTFRYTATQANVDAGSLTNAASVVGTPPTGPAVTATSSHPGDHPDQDDP